MAKDDFLQVGGQAIVEGVMMRSPKFFAIACRAPNGELIVKSEPLEKTWIGKQKWLKMPFLRGSWALLDAMTLGIRAMRFASDIQLAPEYAKPEPEVNAKPSLTVDAAPDLEGLVAAAETETQPIASKKIQDGVIGATIFVSLAFGLLLFKFVPQFVGSELQNKYKLGDIATNLVVESVKFVFFIGYLLLISKLAGVKEVFMYHGAEHKAINVLEAELPLTMENCRNQTRLHPRCGTSFAIIVLILGFFVFPFVPRIWVDKGVFLTAVGNFLLHVAILPFIAGIAYELLRFAGKFRDNSSVMMLFKPGLWTQLITTKEPRDDQIEVALASLQACLDEEEKVKAVTV
jgi:uncharacterized protein YqhQ